jgi:hypothetical protein
MSKVMLDRQLQEKLNGVAFPVELCDESGKTLGHLLPTELYYKLVYAWAKAQVSDEELERAAQEPGGVTLEEFWKTLGVK